jgi:hypothetical protein
MADNAKKGAGNADVEALVRKYLDVWQRQAASLLAPGNIGNAEFTWGLKEWLSAVEAYEKAVRKKERNQTSDPARQGARPATGSAGAETACAAPGSGEPNFGDIARRLAAAEARIAALESRLRRKQFHRGRARSSSAKPRIRSRASSAR